MVNRYAVNSILQGPDPWDFKNTVPDLIKIPTIKTKHAKQGAQRIKRMLHN